MRNQIIIFLACGLAVAACLHFIVHGQPSMPANVPGGSPDAQAQSAGDSTWQLGAVVVDRTNVSRNQVQVRPLPDTEAPVVYSHPHYGLAFSLPADWRGYSVLTQQWEGQSYAPATDTSSVTERGPLLILRHPLWKANDRCQDIPILVFTRGQFDTLHQGKFNVGAGGVELEIAHNDQYVFAISSRFNADDSVKGWEEATEAVERYWTNNTTRLYPQ